MVKIDTKKIFGQYEDFYKIIKGSDFKKLNPTYQPYKIINNKNQIFKFTVGKNNMNNIKLHDFTKINYDFFDVSEIGKYFDTNNDNMIAKIELIDNADITIELPEAVEFDFDYIYKRQLICSTKEFIITKIISKYDYVNSLTDKEINDLINENSDLTKYVK